MALMKSKTFISKAIDIAKNYNTLYVMGCFGAPLTGSNVNRYCTNHSYNKLAARTRMIKAVADKNPPYFGFDCVNLIKAILWGWSGDKTKTYGGAKYGFNGVPDVNADNMITKCSNISTNFSTIIPGEVVWQIGHIGIYIGDGLVVESTPSWSNKVQITALGNIGTKSGYNTRKWTKHGKLPYVDYSDYKASVSATTTTTSSASTTKKPDIIYAVKVNGKWLPEVKNTTDYAGIENKSITDVMIKLSDGTPIKYRVHVKGAKWLSYVTGYNKNDHNNGYAGNGKVIDAIEIKCDKYEIAYKVSSTTDGIKYYSEVKDSQNDYAGVFGRAVDKLQCRVL